MRPGDMRQRMPVTTLVVVAVALAAVAGCST